MLANHPNLDVLYDLLLDDLGMLVNHLKLDDLYDPLSDDSEHACKSSEIGCLVYVLSEQGAALFGNTRFAVDRFHWHGHIGCSKGYSLETYSQK